MRRIFGKTMVELAEKDESIILIIGDNGFGIFDEFQNKFPERFFNMGICEQSIIGVASGMSLLGLKPYVYSITPFIFERPFEQIKIDIDSQNTNVKIIGYGDYFDQGITHVTLGEKEMCSLFRNIISYFPKNGEETKKALFESYTSEKPTFISLMKDKNA